ncbi:MAG: LysM peptidoglycan-binding domain-containing protein [Chloroflexi bacterium]|nr:LysM peptidoglycan-binding domain-containing protein [Chloroflexota bacterium]
MRSLRNASLLLAVLGLLAASLPLTALASPVEQPPAQATNLLQNPGFESFTGGVANNWAPWYLPGDGCGRVAPKYQQAMTTLDARRVKDGSSAQQFFASGTDPGASFLGGLLQTVTGLTPGHTYRFSIWGQAWSSTADDSTKSEGTGPTNFQVGIGNGTLAPDAITTRSQFVDIKDVYAQMTIDIVASGTSVTVATFANPSTCARHTEVFWDAASLTDVAAAATATPSGPTQPPPPTVRVVPTKFLTPTPNAEGKIIYVVQPGNTIIDICGVIGRGSDPTCITDIQKWNGLSGSIISVGQQLIISDPGGASPAATAAPTQSLPTEAPTVDVNAPTAAPTEIPAAAPTATAPGGGAGSICVTLYNDANGNGILDAGEGLVAGGQFALLDINASTTVQTYTTDGASEPHCFEGLASGSYRVSSTAPAGYKATTRSDWDLTLAAGSTANLEFGAQSTGGTATPGGSDSSTGNSALLRAVLAAAGVILLLAAAGVAGFLILTRGRR